MGILLKAEALCFIVSVSASVSWAPLGRRKSISTSAFLTYIFIPYSFSFKLYINLSF